MTVVSESVLYEGDDLRVWVNPSVQKVWQQHRQIENHQPESFGVLVGSTSIEQNEIFIDDLTTPQPKDRQSRISFELQDPAHQKVVDKAHKRSKGTQIYLGTWHTHPQSVPTPSGIDIADWKKCIRRNKDRVLIFVIVGTTKTELFVLKGNTFIAINQIK